MSFLFAWDERWRYKLAGATRTSARDSALADGELHDTGSVIPAPLVGPIAAWEEDAAFPAVPKLFATDGWRLSWAAPLAHPGPAHLKEALSLLRAVQRAARDPRCRGRRVLFCVTT